MILNAARDLIIEDPQRAKKGTGWPCCEWVGRIILRASGAEAPSGWWADMCIHDASKPWSPVQAAQALHTSELVPASIIQPSTGSSWDGPVPVDSMLERFAVGRWHVVQRWRSLNASGTAEGITSGGHTILLRFDGDGVGMVCESSIQNGVRLNGQMWTSGVVPSVGPQDVRPWLMVARAGIALCPLWPE